MFLSERCFCVYEEGLCQISTGIDALLLRLLAGPTPILLMDGNAGVSPSHTIDDHRVTNGLVRST